MKTETKAKHTQGPWSLDRWNGPPNPERYGYHVISLKTHTNAIRVYGEYDESEANARLIAAAPELLSELKAMHSEYCADCKGGCPTLALIAKAEGVTK